MVDPGGEEPTSLVDGGDPHLDVAAQRGNRRGLVVDRDSRLCELALTILESRLG